MFESFKNVRSAYEVVKSVGFDWESPTETGENHVFTLRIDVVRMLGEDNLAPVVWQVADAVGDVLMMHTSPSKTRIRGATPEEVITAVLKSFEVPPKTPKDQEVAGKQS